jgi:hypothetical protein
MKNYIGTKFIKAEEMNYGNFSLRKYGEINKNTNAIDRFEEGYLVEYENNYISWSPKSVFEKAYKSDCNLSFGHAIELMKKDCKVAREGWNGKGMFIYIQNSSFITKEMGRNEVLKNIEGDIKINAHIDMKSADGSIVIGWLASQIDMLSNDWVIVN